MNLRDHATFRLLSRLTRYGADAINTRRRHLTDNASLADEEPEGRDPQLSPLLDHSLEAITLEERLTDRAPMVRLRRRLAPAAHTQATARLDEAPHLGPEAIQEGDPLALPQAKDPPDPITDGGGHREVAPLQPVGR